MYPLAQVWKKIQSDLAWRKQVGAGVLLSELSMDLWHQISIEKTYQNIISGWWFGTYPIYRE